MTSAILKSWHSPVKKLLYHLEVPASRGFKASLGRQVHCSQPWPCRNLPEFNLEARKLRNRKSWRPCSVPLHWKPTLSFSSFRTASESSLAKPCIVRWLEMRWALSSSQVRNLCVTFAQVILLLVGFAWSNGSVWVSLRLQSQPWRRMCSGLASSRYLLQCVQRASLEVRSLVPKFLKSWAMIKIYKRTYQYTLVDWFI